MEVFKQFQNYVSHSSYDREMFCFSKYRQYEVSQMNLHMCHNSYCSECFESYKKMIDVISACVLGQMLTTKRDHVDRETLEFVLVAIRDERDARMAEARLVVDGQRKFDDAVFDEAKSSFDRMRMK